MKNFRRKKFRNRQDILDYSKALRASLPSFRAPTTDESVISTPLKEEAATGAENLDVPQRGVVIGDPVPIVFCRRVSGVGGVLISPGATEARFENSLTNEVTGFYHLVLGEGLMDSIQVRDVFQRSCRVGSFSQTYNKRAGTFIPGNFIVDRGGSYTTPECPSYCGTGGTYTGLSTMAFQCTYPDGVDQWNRQVHCFVRGGMYVTRLLDNILGPSNNVADLLLYLLRNSSKVPEEQIDSVSLLSAATFTNVNGFWFNGVIKESTNVRDWISNNLRYFLLRQYRINGKEGLRPLLPTNADGTLKTTALTWVFTFTEEHIIPGTFDITYTPLADRKPVCINVLWRQQDDLGIAVMRTSSIRYPGSATEGPFEQHDLSSFCASENHAVKVGTYILSKRKHVTHRLQIAVKPDTFNGTLAAGDLVRVLLDRVASTGSTSSHDYLYEVDRIGKTVTGEVELELTHFPVDANLASVVAQEVVSAVGAGVLLPTGLTGVTCDINSSSDTSVPADTSLDPSAWSLPPTSAFETAVTEVSPSSNYGTYGGGRFGERRDDIDSQEGVPDPFAGYPAPGDPNVPPFPSTPAPLVPVLMENGEPAPGGPIPTEWAPGTYTTTITQAPGDFVQYFKVLEGGVAVCPSPASTAVGSFAGGTTTRGGFAYGLYRYDVPGDCGGSKSFGWFYLLAQPGFMPVWTSLGSGGVDAGIIYPTTFTFVNTFVPI